MTLFMGLQKIAKPRVGTSSGKLFFPKQEEPKITQKIFFDISSSTTYGVITCKVYLDGLLNKENLLSQPYNIEGGIEVEIPENCKLYQVEITGDELQNSTIDLPYNLNGEDFTIDGFTGSCCVSEYSLVSTPKGYIKAKDLNIGDIIYGWDFDKNIMKETEILAITHPRRVNIVQITLEDDSYIQITDNHVIWTDIGWAAYFPEKVIDVSNCSNISSATYLFNDNNQKVKIVDIKYINNSNGIPCIDLKTNTENYYANGYLVHNAGCPGDDISINLYCFTKNYNPIKITTPFETVYIKSGETLNNKLSYTVGRTISTFRWYDSNTDTYPSNGGTIYLENYIKGNEIIDIQNKIFNNDTTIDALYNINVPVSFTDTVTYDSEKRKDNTAGTIEYYKYKGYYDSFSGIYVYLAHYNVSGWNDKYGIQIPYISKLSGKLNTTLNCSFYKSNTIFKSWTNSNSYTLTQSEYSSFPSSGTIKLLCSFSNPSNIVSDNKTWVATPNINGNGWIWYCTNGN